MHGFKTNKRSRLGRWALIPPPGRIGLRNPQNECIHKFESTGKKSLEAFFDGEATVLLIK